MRIVCQLTKATFMLFKIWLSAWQEKK